MTFYEAALRVMEREGKPLHVNAIVEIAVKENFLSHVGKSPEEVMQSRLLAMARRHSERRIMATAPQTYGLVEWGLPEDPAALNVASAEPKESNEPPLRPRERHPIPSSDKVRFAGRGERPRGKSRRDEEVEGRRRRRYPPLSEVAFEVLSQAAGPMSALDLAAAARERDLVSEDLGAEALLNALREDNRRRAEVGRKPAFVLLANGEIAVERTANEPSAEVELATPHFLATLAEARVERGPGASRLLAQAAEHRRQIMRLLRRRLADLDAVAFERLAMALLDQQGFRDLKVAKRSKNGPLVVARRKDGLAELRYAVQVVRGTSELGRDEIADLRGDVSHYGAQMGILLSPADVGRDARHEAQAPGQAVVLLWCAEALSDLCLQRHLGASCTTVEVWDLDEEFFRRCREKTREDERGRRRDEKVPVAALAASIPASAPERAERGERPERSERSERPERAERQERSERSDRPERPDRSERTDRSERSERSDRQERSERPDRSERSERAERTERSERPERSGRPDRSERYERGRGRVADHSVKLADKEESVASPTVSSEPVSAAPVAPPVTPDDEARRGEEAQIRAEAHERIEAAESNSRRERAPLN